MPDAEEWSRHFERLLPLMQGPNSIQARTAAHNFSQQFGEDSYLDVSAVAKAVQALTAIGPRQVGPGMYVQRQPQDRDEHFDQAMGIFIDAAQAALTLRASFERAVAANESLNREDCRTRVHQYLGTQQDRVFIRSIVAATQLSGEQVLDALEQLEFEGLLSGDTIKSGTWLVRLNPGGRSLLDGTRPARPLPPVGPITTITGSTFQNSPIAITTGGKVRITILPSIPPELRAAMDADATASLQLRALEEEVAKPAPRGVVVAQIFGGLRTTIESMNVGSEVATHGHEWLMALQTALGHFLH